LQGGAGDGWEVLIPEDEAPKIYREYPLRVSIGMVRAKAKIGLQNLAYNIRRLVTLERLAAA
jgi:hypothetical protein